LAKQKLIHFDQSALLTFCFGRCHLSFHNSSTICSCETLIH